MVVERLKFAAHDDATHGVQDAYSLRCHPQVIGAARDTLAFAVQTAERELQAAIDNPVILDDGQVESAGNFHGEPLAFACDFLAHRRRGEVDAIAVGPDRPAAGRERSRGLPPFLATNPGVNSGMMIAHYTAAALVAENRRLAHPASVDSMSTSANQEDHVSLGWASARNLRQVLTNLSRIIAVEAVCAAQAIDLRDPLTPPPEPLPRSNGSARRSPAPAPTASLVPIWRPPRRSSGAARCCRRLRR